MKKHSSKRLTMYRLLQDYTSRLVVTFKNNPANADSLHQHYLPVENISSGTKIIGKIDVFFLSN